MANNQSTAFNTAVVELDKNDIVELQTTLNNFNGARLKLDEVTRENFPLPKIKQKLDHAFCNVHEGSGLAIVRGLDLGDFNNEDKTASFLGVANYIGEQTGIQDQTGSVLTHITASKNWTVPSEQRHGIHTTTSLPWHCDIGTEILALHVRSMGETGGNTYVSPVEAIYKDLLSSYPTALNALREESWPIQMSSNSSESFKTALLHVDGDRVVISMDPGRLGLNPKTAKSAGKDGLELTKVQKEALEVLMGLASKHKHRLDTKNGDIVFINNWTLLHAREAYTDPEDGPGRHLVRLWLRNPEKPWVLPESMRVPWEAAFGKGGKGFPDLKKTYALAPTLKYIPPLSTAGSAAFMLKGNGNVNCGSTN